MPGRNNRSNIHLTPAAMIALDRLPRYIRKSAFISHVLTHPKPFVYVGQNAPNSQTNHTHVRQMSELIIRACNKVLAADVHIETRTTVGASADVPKRNGISNGAPLP